VRLRAKDSAEDGWRRTQAGLSKETSTAKKVVNSVKKAVFGETQELTKEEQSFSEQAHYMLYYMIQIFIWECVAIQ